MQRPELDTCEKIRFSTLTQRVQDESRKVQPVTMTRRQREVPSLASQDYTAVFEATGIDQDGIHRDNYVCRLRSTF
jgi:hypothetical protein